MLFPLKLEQATRVAVYGHGKLINLARTQPPRRFEARKREKCRRPGGGGGGRRAAGGGRLSSSVVVVHIPTSTSSDTKLTPRTSILILKSFQEHSNDVQLCRFCCHLVCRARSSAISGCSLNRSGWPANKLPSIKAARATCCLLKTTTTTSAPPLASSQFKRLPRIMPQLPLCVNLSAQNETCCNLLSSALFVSFNRDSGSFVCLFLFLELILCFREIIMIMSARKALENFKQSRRR